MVMGIGSKREVGKERGNVQHGSELNSQFSRRMHGRTELEGFTNPGSFETRTNTAPKRGVQEDDVHGHVPDVRGQLLEINNDGIRGQRHGSLFPDLAHAIQPKNRIFKVIIVHSFDSASKLNPLLGGPSAIGVEAKLVIRERGGQTAVTLEFVGGGGNAAFELMGPETMNRSGAGHVRLAVQLCGLRRCQRGRRVANAKF